MLGGELILVRPDPAFSKFNADTFANKSQEPREMNKSSTK